MELRIYESIWGLEGSPGEVVEQIATAGYDGVEIPFVLLGDAEAEMRDAVLASDLGVIALPLLMGQTPEEQLAELPAVIEHAQTFEPDCVVIHSGQDYWHFDELIPFY